MTIFRIALVATHFVQYCAVPWQEAEERERFLEAQEMELNRILQSKTDNEKEAKAAYDRKLLEVARKKATEDKVRYSVDWIVMMQVAESRAIWYYICGAFTCDELM